MPLNINIQSILNGYQRADLIHDNNFGWHFCLKIPNPQSGKLERKRFRLNRIRKQFDSEEEFLKQIERIQSVINAKLENGEPVYLDQTISRSSEPLSKMCASFLADKEKSLRPDTLRSYRSHITMFLQWQQNAFPRCNCGTFNYSKAVQYEEHIKSRFSTMNAYTFNCKIKTMRVLFNWAVNHEYLSSNPFTKIDTMRTEDKYRCILTLEQRQLIREYCMKHCPLFLIVIDMVFNSIIRPHEISMVRLSQIDLEQQVIHLLPSQTKNHRYRDAVICNELAEILKDVLAHNYPSDYYLIGPGYLPGKKGLSSKSYRKKWKRMRERLNLPDNVQLYSLRDTGITETANRVASIGELMSLTGHIDAPSLMHYLHQIPSTFLKKRVESAPRF